MKFMTESNRNSIEFSLSTRIRSGIKLSQLSPYTQSNDVQHKAYILNVMTW